GAAVTHHETHLSHVFLAGRRAWKLKKAVRLPFVDFSTLEARRVACAAELRVNRRTAPALYRAAVPVTEGEAGLALGGDGRVLDWVVEMRRFPDGALFSEMAVAGTLTRAHLRDLADAIAALHVGTPPVPSASVPQRLPRTAAVVAGEVVDLAVGRGEAVSAAAAAWAEAIMAAMAPLGPRLDARARRGAVREGHGDLHFGNVCLFDGRAMPFDAIEFDPALSVIDLLYDLAFPIMDLAAYGLEAEAPLFLGRYLSATRDYGAIDLIAPMASLRAGVRALVALSRPGAAQTARALDHFALAERLLRPPPPARLIAVGGRSGSGKSTIAASLAPDLALPPWTVVLRSDEIRKRLAGVAPEDRLPPEAYTQAASDRVYRRMLRDAARALAAGASVVVDAAFLKASERADAAAVAARAGLRFDGFWLDADNDV
ncbi:MAG: AAA family ATPase, partial [Pseudomonadota bacterium]